MRAWRLFVGDIRFQVKYGFFFLYGIITVLYSIFLLLLPKEWQAKAAIALIYSDPAALGLFFMGAIILLEKSQRVVSALAISPIKIQEYVAAKVCSLALISTAASGVLALTAGLENIPTVMFVTAISSIIFSLLGLIVGGTISSLNQYLLATVPLEILCFVPPLIYLFKPSAWLNSHPLCGAISLLSGTSNHPALDLIRLLVVIVLLSIVTQKIISRSWQSLGGGEG